MLTRLPLFALALLSTSGVITNPSPTFHALRGTSGVDNLEPNLCINGTCVTPTFRYKAGDADATNWDHWTYGEILPAGGSGGTFNDGSPFTGTNDDGVKPAGSRYWAASGTSFADVTTEDMVFEIVMRWSRTNGARVINKYVSLVGWVVDESSNAVRLRFGSGSVVSVVSTSLAGDVWLHLMCFVDRSGSAQWYTNGSADGSPVVVSSQSGSITVSEQFAIANRGNGGSTNHDGVLGYAAMWKSDAWLDTHLQATVAQERYQRLAGLWPQVASGSKPWAVYSRASIAYSDRTESAGVRKLYRVAQGTARVVRRYESDGTTEFTGYLSEDDTTNLCLQSEAFDNATVWTNTNSTDTADAATAPDGETTADSLDEDGTAAVSHCIETTFSASAGTPYVLSVWAEAANRSFARLEVTSSTDGSAYADCNLTTAAMGTTSGVDSSGAEDWGGGRVRCWIRDTRTTAETNTFRICIGEADNDIVFDGLTQASIYLWGGQVQASFDVPSTYIRTTTSTITNNADVLYFTGDDGNTGKVGDLARGTMDLTMMSPDMDLAPSPYIMDIDVGGSGNNRISMQANGSTDALWVFVKDASVATVATIGSTDIFDGDSHTVRIPWKLNDTRGLVDGVPDIATDTACTHPTPLDRIHIGNARSVSQCNCVIRDVRIWPDHTLRSQ